HRPAGAGERPGPRRLAGRADDAAVQHRQPVPGAQHPVRPVPRRGAHRAVGGREDVRRYNGVPDRRRPRGALPLAGLTRPPSDVNDAAAGPALMTGPPPFPPEARVTLANWQDPPFNRWAFQHVRELIPTARISRGSGPPWRLSSDDRDIAEVRFRHEDRE